MFIKKNVLWNLNAEVSHRMENILYIQSWAKKTAEKCRLAISYFCFHVNDEFFIHLCLHHIFFCNVFGCVRDLQHQYFIEFLNYYHSPSSSANSLWLFKWNISSTSSLLKLSNYCCFLCVCWFQLNEISVWNSNRNICIKRCYTMTKYE